MTDTELLDLLESGKVKFSDLHQRWVEVNGQMQLAWCYWERPNGWTTGESLRDCIRKLAELKEKK